MTFKSGSQLALRAGAFAYTAYNTYRGGSKTQTMMRRNTNLPVLVEPGEYTRKNRRHGRYRKKTLSNLYRIVATNQQPTWFRFQGVNRFNSGTGGFFQLFNHLNTTSNVETQPIYLFDLTTIPNTNSSALITQPLPFWTVNRNAATQAWNQANVAGLDNIGLSNANWIPENLALNSNTAFVTPARRGILKYSDLRLMCYGATQVPVKYDVAIVYFPDDVYNPFYGNKDYTSANSCSATSGVLLDDLLAPYSSNPINVQDPKMRSKCKFIFRENFIIQPGVTTEGDASVPHFREVKVFKKWDKFCTFDWQDPVQSDPQANTKYIAEAGQTFPAVTYTKRCFLMIRAISGYTASASGPSFSKTVNPSFDLFVRNKWMIST